MKTAIHLLLASVLLSFLSLAQTQFVKYRGNHVLRVGPGQAWDNIGTVTAGLLFDGQIYRIWYLGWSDNNVGGVGYATSPDGIHWTKYISNPVLTWGSNVAWPNAVLLESGLHHMYYLENAYSELCDAMHATSPDGVTWTPDTLNNPLGLKGNPGSWDDYYIDDRVVLKQDTVWKMWYSGARKASTGQEGPKRIGYATSADGIHWTKPSSFPVLGEGASGTWDGWEVAVGDVLFEESEYRLWYFSNWSIGYATSSDGRVWTKYPGNPVFKETGGDVNTVWVGLCRVIHRGSVYMMWYDQYPNTAAGGTLYQTGFAVDSDSGYVMADPAEVTFGSRNVGLAGDTLLIRIMNYGRHSADVSSLSVSSPNFELVRTKAIPFSLAPLQQDTLRVRFAPKTAGQIVDTLRIRSNSASDPVFSVYLNGQGATEVDGTSPGGPNSYALLQNFPNPFNPSTEIGFRLPGLGMVTLKVYDLFGREVATLVNEKKAPGLYTVRFDGIGLASGVYFYRIHAGGYFETKRMLLLR